MAYGLSSANFANALLNHFRGGAAWSQPAGLYVKLHKGDPGASGTSNASAVTTRAAVAFAAASSGAIALTGTSPTFSMTASESITHISIWDASTAGNFLCSSPLTVQKLVANTDTLVLNAVTLAFVPLAA